MPEHKLHNVVYAAIDELSKAEKVTRKLLAQLSRDLLIYVPETQDIEAVNRLMNVLTPMNYQAARMYFSHFLPWQVEKDNDGNFQRFGKKMQGDKKVKAHLDAITEWLSKEENNIWTWADTNIEVKKKDFRNTVAKTIKKALKGDEKSDTPPLPRDILMDAIFEGGVTIEDMLMGVEKQQERIQEAEDAHNRQYGVNEDEAPTDEEQQQAA